jgi:hypothetical protein
MLKASFELSPQGIRKTGYRDTSIVLFKSIVIGFANVKSSKVSPDKPLADADRIAGHY